MARRPAGSNMSGDEPTQHNSSRGSSVSPETAGWNVVDSASPVSDEKASLRFGLRAMLGIIAFCCGIFAIMSYLGVLVGMVGALVGCVLLLVCLIFSPVVFRLAPQSRHMTLLDAVAIRLTLAILLLVMGVVLAGGGELVFSQLQRLRQQSQLEKQLGFISNTQYVCDDQNDYGSTWKAVMIESIEASGLLDEAGFQEGDVVTMKMSPQEFFEMLAASRGETLIITVDRSGSGPELDPSTQVDLEVRIPE